MPHTRKHSFTGNTDHDFTGLNPNTIPILDNAGTGLTNSSISEAAGIITVNGSIQINGNVDVLGTATTINTQTLQALDNLIVLNYSGTHISAAYGGIAITSAKTDNGFATWSVNIEGAWSANTPGTFTGLRADASGTTFEAVNSAGTSTFSVKDDGVIYSGASPLQTILNNIVGSSGFSGWTASSGIHSIIANNGTGNLATNPYSIVGGQSNSAYTSNTFIGSGKDNLNSGTYGFIGGGKNNLASGQFASIFNGFANSALTSYSAVINGKNNIASGDYAIIVGGIKNIASGYGSKILGGYSNKALAYNSTVLGGYGNDANSASSFNGIGFYNKNSGQYGNILNGRINYTDSNTKFGTIVNGDQNRVSATTFAQFYSIKVSATVLGGYKNIAVQGKGAGGVVLGGRNNLASGNYYGGATLVGNGRNNNAINIYSTILNGYNNNTFGVHSTILGGKNNINNGRYSIIGNGRSNSAMTTYSFIGTGLNNLVSGNSYSNNTSASFIGGGKNNIALDGNNSSSSAIVGGQNNFAGGSYYTFSFVGAGFNNQASGEYSTIVSGKNNIASGQYSFIGGGAANTSSAQSSVVVGGGTNFATNTRATIVGGGSNLASGISSFIGGGRENSATTTYSSILGGKQNRVTGTYSSILAGKNITATASEAAYVPFLYIISASTDNTLTDILVRDSSGEIKVKNLNITTTGLTSGLISGGTITINSIDNTKFDISAGEAVIVDFWTTIGTPVEYRFSWPAQTGISVTYLSSSTQSYIAIDKNGNLTQYSSYPSNAIRRDNVLLAQLGHAAKTIIASVNPYISSYDSPIEAFRDIIREFKLINYGNIISANGANLQINKSSGTLFGMGVDFLNNTKNPNEISVSGQTAASFRYRTQTGGTTSPVSLIDPTKYDLGGVITSIAGGPNSATNQRIYLFPNGNIVIQYGQTVYTTLANAISNAQYESFTEFTNLSDSATLIGILSVTNGATNLSDTTQARFLRVSKLGETVGAAAGISVTTLQNAYTNSSEPEIITNSTLGAITIKNGTGVNNSNQFEIQNSASTTTFFVTSQGNLSGNSLSSNTLTSGLMLNTRIRKRFTNIASSATPSLNTDNYDVFSITGLSTNITSLTTNLTGTPTHGDLFSLELTDNGVARTLTFGASFSNTGTLSLPTTTVISTLLRCLFQWNSATSKWEIVASV